MAKVTVPIVNQNQFVQQYEEKRFSYHIQINGNTSSLLEKTPHIL